MQFDWLFENNGKFCRKLSNHSNDNDVILSLSNKRYNVALLSGIEVTQLALPS